MPAGYRDRANGDGRGAVGDTVSPSTSVGEGEQRKAAAVSKAVLGRVWLYGMALALALAFAGFGVIATFINTLFL